MPSLPCQDSAYRSSQSVTSCGVRRPPAGTCWRCRPGGANRTCRACNGTGMRPRLAFQLYAYLRRLYRDGSR